MNKKLLLCILTILFVGEFVFAANEGVAGLTNPIPDLTTISGLIDKIVDWLLNIGLMLAPLMFVIGGIMFITANGEPAKIKNGQNLMIYTAIGLLVILLAKSLVEVLKGFIG